MLNVALWIIFGGLVGWIASMVARSKQQLPSVIHIVVGVLGALVGGWFMHEMCGSGITAFNVVSLAVAVLGASTLLVVFKLISRES